MFAIAARKRGNYADFQSFYHRHTYICMHRYISKNTKITSEFLTKCINVNPVVIRRLLQQLKAADLINVQRGSGGATITRPLNEISLLDVYNAVECLNHSELSIDSTCTKFARVADNGKTYQYQFYSLSAIIAVGYRINSARATQFRQ
jgi:hypothetical protein